MLNTPAVLQSQLDALKLTKIIKEPTRYNPKSVNMDTLIDIILTNLPSKYTSAVFNQELSDHYLIACVRGQTTIPHHYQTLQETAEGTPPYLHRWNSSGEGSKLSSSAYTSQTN